ncbi:MAG: hypothetical protein M1817_001895 [Caeruleum heppii]|nr:MAG: hypothetical protein M1817_001895 [Caeruleum heppii]
MENSTHVPPASQKTAVRDLGTFERFRVAIHDLGFHYNVAIAARYSNRNTPLDRPLIFEALRKTIDDHSALGVQVTDHATDRPSFVRLARFHLRDVVTFVPATKGAAEDVASLEAILSDQHSRPFEDQDLPLWRIVIVPRSAASTDVIFVWHHVIGDGRSGLAFHASFLDALNSPSIDKAVPDGDGADSSLVIVPERPLAPPLEDVLTLSQSLRTLLSLKFGSYLAPWSTTKTEGKWSGSSYHVERPTKTHIRLLIVPSEAQQRLTERCRQEKTTITALLQTAVGKVLAEQFDAQQLRCAIAISLRRFFPSAADIDDATMGLWVSTFHANYGRDELVPADKGAFPWDNARHNRRLIEHEIERGDKDIAMGLLRYFGDFHSYLTAKLGRRRDDSYAITNLGLFDGKDVPSSAEADGTAPPWAISNIYFSQSCHVVGSALQFCIVSTKSCDMVIALSWQDGTVSIEDAEKVRQHLSQELLNLAGHSTR